MSKLLAELIIEWPMGDEKINGTEIILDPLEVAQIVAARHGFTDGDIDYESYGDKGVSVTLTGPGKSLTVKGKTIELAVVKLLERLY